MKKAIMILFVAAVVLGLAACSHTAENQDAPPQIIDAVQNTDEEPASNSNIITSTNPQTPTQEQLVGTIQSIDEMSIAIATIQAMIFNESSPGQQQHMVMPRPDEPQEPQEPQDVTIRLTEHTIIEINEISIVTNVGQMADKRAGTLDDLALDAFVMATGEWHGEEFVATSLLLMLQ